MHATTPNRIILFLFLVFSLTILGNIFQLVLAEEAINSSLIVIESEQSPCDYIRSYDKDNQEQAIKKCLYALQVITRDKLPLKWASIHNNLAEAYRVRISGEQVDNLEQAIKHYKQALEVRTPEVFPGMFIQSVSGLSSALIETQQYSIARLYLISALQINERQLQEVSFIPKERQQLVKQAQSLFSNIIWVVAQMGHYVEAMHLFEWGKARILRQTLVLDEANIKKYPIETQNKLKKLQTDVFDLENQLLSQANNVDVTMQATSLASLEKTRQQLQETINAIGIESSKPPHDETVRQWLEALQPGDVLIAPSFSDFGTVVFILPTSTPHIGKLQTLMLPEFSRKDLYNIIQIETEGSLTGYLPAYSSWTKESNKEERLRKRKIWQNQLSSSLDIFRDRVMKPIVARIHKLSRMPSNELSLKPDMHFLWIPDGESSLLPVHAIIIDNKPLLTQYTVQFIPSLYSFYTVRQHLLGSRRDNNLLAVINPTEDLSYASIEGEIISRFFTSKTVLAGRDGNLSNFEQALSKKPTYLHLSTHGSFDWSNILESGLDLSKGQRLTLGNLLSEPDKFVGSRLVVLSACETGLVDLEVPAESLGLPAAFMQAGTPGIISTLWTVDEISTMFLMGKFYELHLGELQLEPPRALALAQEWLRTATYQTLRDWLSPIVTTTMVTMADKTNSPQITKMVSALKYFREMTNRQATTRPYQELYYWAGFVYSGV